MPPSVSAVQGLEVATCGRSHLDHQRLLLLALDVRLPRGDALEDLEAATGTTERALGRKTTTAWTDGVGSVGSVSEFLVSVSTQEAT